MPSRDAEGRKRKGKSSVTAVYKGPWCAEVSCLVVSTRRVEHGNATGLVFDWIGFRRTSS
jgi:hypothetical protein